MEASQSGESNHEDDEVDDPISTLVSEPGPSVSEVRRSHSDPTNNVDTMDTEGQAAGALEQPRTDVTGGGSEIAVVATIDNPGLSEDLDMTDADPDATGGDWHVIFAAAQEAETGGDAGLLATQIVPSPIDVECARLTGIHPGIKERVTEGALKLMGEFRELLGV